MDWCSSGSSYGKTITGFFQWYFYMGGNNELDDLDTILGDGRTFPDCTLGGVAAISPDGEGNADLLLSPFFMDKWHGPQRGITMAHEVGHVDSGHINNLCNSAAVYSTLCSGGILCCDQNWDFNTRGFAFQRQIVGTSSLLGSRFINTYNRTNAELATDLRRIILADARSTLRDSFSANICVTMDDDGDINFSACGQTEINLRIQPGEACSELGCIMPTSHRDSRRKPEDEPEPEPEEERRECYEENEYDPAAKEVCYYDVCPDDSPVRVLLGCDYVGDGDDGVAEEPNGSRKGGRGTVEEFCIIDGCETPFIDGRCPAEGCWFPLREPDCNGIFQPDPCQCSEC